MEIDFYIGSNNNTLKTTPFKQYTIKESLEIIKSDKYKTKIKEIRKSTSKDTKSILKKALPFFVFQGTFTYRNKYSLIKASGILLLDIDNIKKENIDTIKDEFKNNPYTNFIFISPSGNGLKVGIKIPEVKNDLEYKEYWHSIAKHYNLPEKIDTQAKDIARACFVSYDPELYYNHDSKVYRNKLKAQSLQSLDYIKINHDLVSAILPEWKQGKRQALALNVVGALRLKGYGMMLIQNVLKNIMDAAGDIDYEERFSTIKSTFEKNDTEIRSYGGLKELLSEEVFRNVCFALDKTIRKPRQVFKLMGVTSHLHFYGTLDKALGLYGNRYATLKKLLSYSLIGNAVKTSKPINYHGTIFDTREHMIVFANSGTGKNDVVRVIKDTMPFLQNYAEISSIHPEQLIGRTEEVLDKETKEKQIVEIRGYLDEDYLVIDEARDYFRPLSSTSQNLMVSEIRAHFCRALNPIGTNEISKQLVKFGRKGRLSYMPNCTVCILSQPTIISEDAIRSGFMRRFTVALIDGKEERKSVYEKRTQGEDKSIHTNKLQDYFNDLNNNLPLGKFDFENINEDLVLYANYLCEYGINHSEKAACFIMEIYEQSMYDKLLKYSVLSAVNRKSKVVTRRDVQVAYMDLFEIMTGVFDTFDMYAEDFYSNGVKYNDLLVLRWLRNEGAVSKDRARLTRHDVKRFICDVYEVRDRQASNYLSKMKDKKLITINRTKRDSYIYVGEKGLELLKIDDQETNTDFYKEYLRICEEVKNEKSMDT